MQTEPEKENKYLMPVCIEGRKKIHFTKESNNYCRPLVSTGCRCRWTTFIVEGFRTSSISVVMVTSGLSSLSI